MDLSKPLTSRSIHKLEDQDDNVILSKYDKFYASAQRQSFSMPDSVMFYMAKNPKTAELYQKVVQTCKYFFVKNSILVISSLFYYGEKWSIGGSRVVYDLADTTSKFWITEKFYAIPANADVQNSLSPLIPKLFRSDAKAVMI
uniref:Uncharacterized protein n=1 Tax=Panagrolaimus davidi TaxID=227884 RepID=A0A914QMY2_9BILA